MLITSGSVRVKKIVCLLYCSSRIETTYQLPFNLIKASNRNIIYCVGYMLQVNPADRPDIKEVLTGLEAIAIAMDVDLKGKVVSTQFSLFLVDQSDFHYSPLTVSPLCCLVNLFP